MDYYTRKGEGNVVQAAGRSCTVHWAQYLVLGARVQGQSH